MTRDMIIHRATRMILASHVIISAYGFWLPNEERGSWSDFVRDWELFYHAGPATKVDTTRSVARRPCDWNRRDRVRAGLRYPPALFTGEQARGIAEGFHYATCHLGYTIHAAALLPEHAHLVVARHAYDVRQVINQLKGWASRRLLALNLHPFQDLPDAKGDRPSMWGRGCWVVYLDSDEDVRRAIRYVDNNPVKERKKKQAWKFVRPYQGSGATRDPVGHR